MCGIAGIIDDRPSVREAVTARMLSALEHRGPDMGGSYSADALSITLGHRRLSILDLTDAGRQPMTSPSGRYVVTFNGEIYNFADIRSELLGKRVQPFRGSSDTEVMLHGFDEWGIEATLARMNGMFAFGVIDQTERSLTLVRDRIGEKPLFFGCVGRSFIFASELRAFSVHPEWSGVIDRAALALFCRFGFVPAPYSIFEGIRKLSPGCLLRLPIGHGSMPARSFGGSDADIESRTERYWNIGAIAAGKATIRRQTKSFEYYREAVEQRLLDAVRHQMVADVPVGAFLSSGVDSATVAALMQSVASRPINTFTVAFGDPAYNEAPAARRIAAHLGTKHTEIQFSASDALDLVPRLALIYDEPFADPSQLPTRLICEYARRHVSVCLTGDGGDEIFCGYNRYTLGAKLHSLRRWIPSAGRAFAAERLERVSPAALNAAVKFGGRFFASLRNVNEAGMMLRRGRLVDVLRSSDDKQMYRQLLSYWSTPSNIVRGSVEPDILETCLPGGLANGQPLERYMLWDQLLYLPDDNLAKVDRAAMSVSLETRLPLLSYDLIEFSWEIPRAVLLHEGRTKAILRAILAKHVPAALTDGPKMGFSVPLAHWLRNDLKDWAASKLFDARLSGFFHASAVRDAWIQHQSGRQDHSQRLWALLMFAAWLETQKSVV